MFILRSLLFLPALFVGIVHADTLLGRVVGVADGDTITVIDADRAASTRTNQKVVVAEMAGKTLEVEQTRSTTTPKENREQELRKLTATHPDWEKIIRTPEFSYWRDNVISDGKKLMKSEDAAFISLSLSQFKEWLRTRAL